MYRSFEEIEREVLASGVRVRIALAGAHDEDALAAVVHAHRRGVVEGVLIGDAAFIREQLAEAGEDASSYRVIDEPDGEAAAALAVKLVREGEADMPMKGLMHTSTFMHAILNKETGLREPGQLLSQASLVEVPEMDRLIIVTDVAVNIAPDIDQKVSIIRNAAGLASCIGLDDPKIALLSALEVENPAIPSTVEAARIAEMLRDEFTIAGPLALDNAISPEAARHKGVEGPVAGVADILVVPDLWSGNIFSKALVFFAHLNMAGVLCGLSRPAVMTSRSETPENKYYSILVSALQALRMQGRAS